MNEIELLKAKYEIALREYAKLWRKHTGYNKMTTTFDKDITEQAEKALAEKAAKNDGQ